MDQFVCVRIVQGWGLDLSVFQFDWRQTWSVFLMNGDRAVYCRFSARQANDIEALRKALEGALELHRAWPANKAELAGKIGPAPLWPKPEEIPSIKEKGKFRPIEGKGGCIHCHNILEGHTKSLKNAGRPIPGRFLEPYPIPERAGLTFVSRERATVDSVTKGSTAEKAGILPGDRIVRLEGQPILSIADVQWVIYLAPDPGSLKAEIDRGGTRVEVTILLPAGWRSR